MPRPSIIVTGAGRGIGLSILNTLLKKGGPDVLIVAVDLLGEELQRIHAAEPNRTQIVLGDVTKRETSARALKTIKKHGGQLHTLILNAGILGPIGKFADADIDQWKKLFEVNFFALIHTIQLSLPELRANKGKIIMTSSGVTQMALPAWLAYACAKSAMNYLCLGLPSEEPDVATVCIMPGTCDTDMQRKVREDNTADMPKDLHDLLIGFKNDGKLLHPDQPAASYAKMALGEIPKEVQGQVVDWDNKHLTALSFPSA